MSEEERKFGNCQHRTTWRRRSGHQRMRWLDGIIDAMNMNLGKLQEMVRNRVCYSPWGCKELDIKKKKRVGHDWATEQQQELDKTTKV